MHVPRETGSSPTRARSSSNPTRQLFALGGEVVAEEMERLATVEVVGVGDGEGSSEIEAALGGEDGVDGAAQVESGGRR